MFIKKILARCYALYLKQRWHMTSVGSMLLAQVFFFDYINNPAKALTVFNVHRKGFSLIDWKVMRLTKKNFSRYLKTASYYAAHPLNGQYSAWIDDKLTLKFLCAGTCVDKYMPEYYFQIDDDGRVLRLSNETGGGCEH